MTREELDSYKTEIEYIEPNPSIIKCLIDQLLKNCEGTDEREAPKGKAWIDFWRAMTGHYSRTLYCSSCGKEIFVGKPTLSQLLKFSEGDDDVEKHRAEGGHIWVVAGKDSHFIGGRYITPLCPGCNAQRGKKIIIQKGSKLCKEVLADK